MSAQISSQQPLVKPTSNYHNMEYLRAYSLKWRHDHLDYLKEKIRCECGEVVGREYLTRHRLTKKHTKRLNSPQV